MNFFLPQIKMIKIIFYVKLITCGYNDYEFFLPQIKMIKNDFLCKINYLWIQ